jgi:hypothetical protein
LPGILIDGLFEWISSYWQTRTKSGPCIQFGPNRSGDRHIRRSISLEPVGNIWRLWIDPV